MAFSGFNEDGEPCYDSKEAAIERARQMAAFEGEPDQPIFIQRDWAPLWLAHLLQGTFLEFLCYEKLHSDTDHDWRVES